MIPDSRSHNNTDSGRLYREPNQDWMRFHGTTPRQTPAIVPIASHRGTGLLGAIVFRHGNLGIGRIM